MRMATSLDQEGGINLRLFRILSEVSDYIRGFEQKKNIYFFSHVRILVKE